MNSLTKKLRLTSAGVVLASLCAGGQIASAASSSPAVASAAPAPDAFTFRLGGFAVSNIKTELALSTSNGQVGDKIEFAKNLGGDDSLNVFRFDGDWRFAAKHKLQLTYYDINMDASKIITGAIKWGDVIYPVNTTINSKFQTTIYKLNYAYTFYRNQTHEINGQIGAHITSIEAGLSSTNVPKREGVSVTAPLPVIGLEWNAKLSDQFSTKVSYQYFGVSLEDDKYSGNLSDFLAVVDYRFHRNWTVGGGYNRYVIKAAVKGDRPVKLDLKHQYNGLILYVGVNF